MTSDRDAEQPSPTLRRTYRVIKASASSVFWAAAFVSALLAGREFGLLETAELLAYDVYLRARPAPTVDAQVAVIEIDDAALDIWGWPVPDGALARVIDGAVEAGAAAVAVDIYRDRQVPPGSAALASSFAGKNVFGAMKFARGDEAAVAPPPALAATNRFGFVDFPVDDDGVMRRALLYLDDGSTVFPSLALSATRHVLSQRGIQPVGDPNDPAAMRLGATTISPLAAHTGPYAEADSGGYQILIDFRRPLGAVPVVNARELVGNPAVGAPLAGRIVFIGIASELVKDLVVAPLQGGTASGLVNGVMLHAWSADQLIRFADGAARPLAVPPAWAEIVLIVAAAVIGLAAGFAAASPLGIAVAGLAVLGIWAGGTLVLFRADIWIPVVPSILVAGASLAIAVGGRAAGERHERQALMRLFAQQVSSEVAKDLWRRRDELLDDGLPRPLRLSATILFLDLAGSTTIADQLAPEVYMDWVGRFLESMAETAIDHGGLVDKYTGDGLMIVFGAPVPRTDDAAIAADARAAVDCARSMAKVLAGFNIREKASGRPRARIRVGVHSGSVFAGCVGAKRRRQYTVTGAAVNAAARLESLKELAGPGGESDDWRVLVSEATMRLIGENTGLVPAGSAVLRGFAEPINIYRLDDARDSVRSPG